MLIHPDVQRKAYTEIVRVIGRDRLPEFHEVDAIPYVHALVKELLRWQPVGPLGMFMHFRFITVNRFMELGFPHANGEHDEYKDTIFQKDLPLFLTCGETRRNIVFSIQIIECL